MKETNRYGIVLVLPDDAREREEWGQALIARYNEHASYRHEPFGVVVFICFTGALAKQLLKGGTDRNVILLGPDGRTVIRAREDLTTLSDWKPFVRAFTELAYGLRDTRLKEQAGEIEKNVSEKTRKAVREYLEGKGSTEARAILLETADLILPWLVSQCREVEAKLPEIDGEHADPPALRWLVVEHMRSQSLLDHDPSLPFGVKVQAVPEPDPCPPCGRAMVGAGIARKFLSFFEK
jgi:hypothetical protein